jgi:membrane carboxypeptidase/penicillin-binding protein
VSYDLVREEMGYANDPSEGAYFKGTVVRTTIKETYFRDAQDSLERHCSLFTQERFRSSRTFPRST